MKISLKKCNILSILLYSKPDNTIVVIDKRSPSLFEMGYISRGEISFIIKYTNMFKENKIK